MHSIGLLDQHESAVQVVCVGLELVGQVGHVGRDQMVVDDITQQIEPEQRQLREHRALVRDLVFEDVVECGDAVRGDQQQLVAQVVQVANFALRIGLDVDSAHCVPFIVMFAPDASGKRCCAAHQSTRPLLRTAAPSWHYRALSIHFPKRREGDAPTCSACPSSCGRPCRCDWWPCATAAARARPPRDGGAPRVRRTAAG